MGGGVSLMEGVEELMTATILIGKAISSCQMPGMYRIYDFHSSHAPKLKSARQINFFSPDSDSDDDESAPPPDPSEYEHFFKVIVGDDAVYIEEPLMENEGGWVPLHACCMSLSTVNAGISLIDEMIRLGGSLDVKTNTGPGSFNSGWTSLHMACAYGVEPLVEKLVHCGADVNCKNSFGYTPLLEACHRGYIVVAKFLLSSGQVDLAYIPSEEEAANSPFQGAPCQSALAEAARCGFFKVVQLLLENGAPKDLANELGWTALHEACFYNRMETVKTLLLNGANAALRTNANALPYHLASIVEIRTMLESMGGPEAAPTDENDTVDMMRILTELTMPAAFRNGGMKQLMGGDDDGDDAADNNGSGARIEVFSSGTSGAINMPTIVVEPNYSTKKHTTPSAATARAHNQAQAKASSSSDADADNVGAKAAGLSSGSNRVGDEVQMVEGKISQDLGEGGGNPLLHSGAMLGNLPSLNKTSPSKSKSLGQSDVDAALSYGNSAAVAGPLRVGGSGGSGSGGGVFGSPVGMNKSPSTRADDKSGASSSTKKKKRKDKTSSDPIPKDMPSRFICQLTQRPMSDPVKTRYGNVYDRTAIMNWLETQGKICPLTGAPLSQVDLISQEELGDEIRQWLLKKSLAQQNNNNNSGSSSSSSSSSSSAEDNNAAETRQIGGDQKSVPRAGVSTTTAAAADTDNDDLYDF